MSNNQIKTLRVLGVVAVIIAICGFLMTPYEHKMLFDVLLVVCVIFAEIPFMFFDLPKE